MRSCRRTTAGVSGCRWTACRSAASSAPTWSHPPYDDPTDAGSGSIIAILATDAPLLPHQCERLAQRAGLGVARAGGGGEHSSGDLFLAFSTANRGRIASYKADGPREPVQLDMLPDAGITDLFWAAIESTEEAILNALVAAETMTGIDGVTAHALDHERLLEVMTRFGRGPG